MSKDIKSRKWTLKAHFSGLPKREDLEIVEEQVPELKDGGTKKITRSIATDSLWMIYALVQHVPWVDVRAA